MKRIFPIRLFLVLISIFAVNAPLCASDLKKNYSKLPVTVLIDTPAQNLDPLFATDLASQRIVALAYASLVRFDENQRLVGDLAESWSQKQYRTFQFRLKPNLHFQDGSPLTAPDIVSALRCYIDPQMGSPHRSAFVDIQSISSRGTDTVLIETKNPSPYLLSDLTLAKIFKPCSKTSEKVGSGSYQIVSEKLNTITLKRTASTDEQHISQLNFKYVREDITRFQLLQTHGADVMINGLSLSKTDYLKAHPHPDIQIKDSAGINVSYLGFNFKNPYLSKRLVREAIAHAINRELILKSRIQSYGTPSNSLLARVHAEYSSDAKSYDYNLKKAEQLLDLAGLPVHEDGTRFSLVYKTVGEKYGIDMARIIAAMLKDIGIKVNIQTAEYGTFYSDLRSGNFDLYSSRWVGIANASIFRKAFHSSEARGSYHNTNLDLLIERGLREPDDRVREKIFRDVQNLAAEDLACLPLWHWSNTFIGPSTFQNVVLYPNGAYSTLAEVTLSP